jgi:hypothetical protein
MHDISLANVSMRIFNFELLGAIDDMKESYVERAKYYKLAVDCVNKLQSLFSSVSDLAVRFFFHFVLFRSDCLSFFPFSCLLFFSLFRL